MNMWHMLQKFHVEVIDSSSDEESDQSTQTLATTAASMMHEFTSNRGGARALSRALKNLPAVEGQLRLHRTTSTSPIWCSRKNCFGAGTRFQGTCSWSFYGALETTTPPSNVGPMQQGQYSGHGEGRTVILEAIISQDLRIWHSLFGMAGSNNDIYVLHRSLVFNRLMQGKAPRVSYEIIGNEYDKPYYLADDIYPDWATLVKIVRNPNSGKTRRFAKMQEACRKDVERGFGVLQARWAIFRHPART
ncbi:hypothetical protein QYE76_051642 [Lolium multiflorum]|uniref:Uncharacterized protein n=1 Tax=Lolium multiflorum TaxID=4521 RepID=A0AAD8SU17_LOLMU|nr:hypothetical protein QYE76_051642 [Lolium multiflorum]